ncbi:hypothetical protein Tco_1438591 [Tanacetum coccineum]
METKDTLSSCSDLKEQEIQKLQMQAKIFKENSLNKLNALKSTTQLLERQTFTNCPLFQRAFAQPFNDDLRTFKFQLSQHMNNLETQLKAETVHEIDSKSALRNDKRLVNQSNTSGDEHNMSWNECNEKSTSRDDTDIRPIYDEKPMVEVPNTADYNVFTLERQHSAQPESINDTYVLEKDDSNVTPDSSNICNNDNQVDQNAAECADERAALANLIANLTLDTKENKKILKQLMKANISLTQELKECNSKLEESNRALRESTSTRDSCLIALQNKQTELEKHKSFNDQTVAYDILQTKLNETLGLLA